MTIPRIAIVGTYPPTSCGIATFTESLRAALITAVDDDAADGAAADARVIRLVDTATPRPRRRRPSPSRLRPEVVAEWVRSDAESLDAAVAAANRFDTVILQHEFGIYGGPDGAEVLAFARACQTPIIAVLHTVLCQPSPAQRAIVEALAGHADLIVVQTMAARSRLLSGHNVDPSIVTVVPHGAVENFDGPIRSLGRADHPTVLTWGLLGPGKGIETALLSIAMVEGPPDTLPDYYVAGKTHPNVVAESGESYRNSLIELADNLGLGERVVFDNAYRGWDSLRELIRSADVVLLPYESRDQVTSGVLVEALASGRPVVATAFPHAVEALAGGAGIVVPHDDPHAMATALSSLLGDPARRRGMERAARAEAENLLWPKVGARYLALATDPQSILIDA